MVINVITLGCSKNLVDSEYLLKQFEANGHKVYHDQQELTSDVLIINTCGFILDAKKESVETILSAIELKKSGSVGRIFVMGCLSERYRDDLSHEMPEIDGFYGVWDLKEIVKAVGATYYKELITDRLTTTPPHFAFLKISEGCNRQCSFCAIPGIRGKQQSKSVDQLVVEANNLANRGVKEIILIAQDLTNYGVDLFGNRELPSLLQKLVQINKLEWIRLHYSYPTGFPDEVTRLMSEYDKICNYIDIPIQHINNRILKSMKRGHDRNYLEKLLNGFRKTVPDIAIRSTVLTGYPGETEAEFLELFDFIREFKFERLGVFPYSEEDGTAAALLKDNIPEKIKLERVDKIMELQQKISLEINENKVGQTKKVIIDREEPDYYIGRTAHDSPDVDNEVLVSKTHTLTPGNFYQVYIENAVEFDLFGKAIIE